MIFQGVKPEDCLSIGKLVGYKVFLNEFVAYQKLGDAVTFRDQLRANGTFELYRSGNLTLPANQAMIWDVGQAKI